MNHSDGLNEADEMNLYMPNPLLDSPFGAERPGMALPPARRRRRLADQPPGPARAGQLHQPDRRPAAAAALRARFLGNEQLRLGERQPGQPLPQQPALRQFRPPNARTSPATSTAATAGDYPTPSLAHRNKKINLNYPLPVSNDPNEPIRQKWISDAYQLLKSVLPPKAVDTPEELAQLSQFIVNMIDFRDPDCTMTHFRSTRT